jgi:hypothetical protein
LLVDDVVHGGEWEERKTFGVRVQNKKVKIKKDKKVKIKKTKKIIYLKLNINLFPTTHQKSAGM